MKNPVLKTKRYLECLCKAYDFGVEHLLNRDGMYGPWYCHAKDCNHSVRFSIRNGRVCDVSFTKEKEKGMLFLLKFGDMYLVARNPYVERDSSDLESWDYKIHSHDCPGNLLRDLLEVYDGDGRDPHGRFRYVSAVPDGESNLDQLDKADSLGKLFFLFRTDGTPPESVNWPEENGGVLPWLAALNRPLQRQ